MAMGLRGISDFAPIISKGGGDALDGFGGGMRSRSSSRLPNPGSLRNGLGHGHSGFSEFKCAKLS